MSSYKETQYKLAVIGLLSIMIGALIGGFATYFAAHQLYQEQQSDELKNIARAMDINFETFNAAYVAEYASELNNSTYKTPMPGRPLYTQNDPYFVFARDISKFNYTISSGIYEFYSHLFKAEEDRLYILQHLNDTNPDDQKNCIDAYVDMRYRIMVCGNKVPEIRSQLQDIYNKK